MIDLDLFAGAGGLALGLQKAGFGPVHLYERDGVSCQTLRHNATVSGTLNATVLEGDVKEVDWSSVSGPVRLLAAGAPCQPFSLGGRHQAQDDGRNLFPEVARALRSVRPMAVLVENVKGLLRESFRPYFDYILRQLEYPSLAPRADETWQRHDRRLRQNQCAAGYEPEYLVSWRLLDAADFGVPQVRQRVFIVAVRAGLNQFSFPIATHSRAALVHAQSGRGYWSRHGLKPRAEFKKNGLTLGLDDGRLPWVTVRDCLKGLPRPVEKESGAVMNHWSIPGAKAYAGHVGSDLDLPAKTIKAGVHGVPGGENAVVEDSGRIRYFTLRELARIQTFPDDHFFVGARIHVTRQLGNAVPCRLALAVGRRLKDLLEYSRS